MFGLKSIKVLFESLGKPSEQNSDSVAVVLIHAMSIVFYIIFQSMVVLPLMHRHPSEPDWIAHSCPTSRIEATPADGNENASSIF